MTAGGEHGRQATKPCDVTLDVMSVKESTKVTKESAFQHQVDTDEPVAPETTNQSMAEGEEVDQAISAAEVLVSMTSVYSSPLVWFAKIVTNDKHDHDFVSLQKRAHVLRGQRDNRVNVMKGKRAHVETKKCVVNWEMMKTGKRSKRVPDRNPMSTFLGLLSKWR